MKLKTLAILAAVATFAAMPFAQAATTTLVADEMGDASTQSGTTGDNIGNPDMSSTTNQATNDMMPGANPSMGNNAPGSATLDSSNSNDDMSADTATGDDDY